MVCIATDGTGELGHVIGSTCKLAVFKFIFIRIVIPIQIYVSSILDRSRKDQDNIVVMKAFKSMDKIAALMESNGVPLDRATVISNLGMEGEYIGPMEKGREYGYFTTVIIKRCTRI